MQVIVYRHVITYALVCTDMRQHVAIGCLRMVAFASVRQQCIHVVCIAAPVLAGCVY